MEKDPSDILSAPTGKFLATSNGHPWGHTSDLEINQVRNSTIFSRKKLYFGTGPSQKGTFW